MRDTDSPDDVARRLRVLLDEQVLGQMDEFQTEAALIELWKTGQSPGMSESGRLMCLGLLLHRAGRRDEAVAVRSELEVIARHQVVIMKDVEQLRRLEC